MNECFMSKGICSLLNRKTFFYIYYLMYTIYYFTFFIIYREFIIIQSLESYFRIYLIMPQPSFHLG